MGMLGATTLVIIVGEIRTEEKVTGHTISVLAKLNLRRANPNSYPAIKDEWDDFFSIQYECEEERTKKKIY